MQINDENIKWAARKLSRFHYWPGFPQEREALESRARAFLRLVHNQTVREILTESCSARGLDPQALKFDKVDPDANDADWILDLIEETMEVFPLPIQMRRLYNGPLPPATSLGDVE